ncbi:hypothetical protein SK128_021932, partial [Halocaridina rubra]
MKKLLSRCHQTDPERTNKHLIFKYNNESRFARATELIRQVLQIGILAFKMPIWKAPATTPFPLHKKKPALERPFQNEKKSSEDGTRHPHQFLHIRPEMPPVIKLNDLLLIQEGGHSSFM